MSERPQQLKLGLADSSEKKQPTQSKPASQSAPKQNIDATKSGAIAPEPKEVIKMTDTATKPKDFESMLTELEKVVNLLEGELKLEEALALFEKGLTLSQDCEKFLQGAQQKIEILKRSASGEITTERFGDADEAEALS